MSESEIDANRVAGHSNQDDRALIHMLTEARQNIHWELESPAFYVGCNKLKYVLRYVPRRKMWAFYSIYADSDDPTYCREQWYYYKEYSKALDRFNSRCEIENIDPSQVKRIRIVPNTK